MTKNPRLRAIQQALLVALLWSTSWVLIKWFLDDIPPLTYAGLRYSLATLILLPGLRKHKAAVRAISRRDWRFLVLFGVVYYTLAQGGQYMALAHLDTVTVSLLLNFASVFVALSGIIFLREIPTLWQWVGLAVFLGGVYIYFYPLATTSGSWLGYAMAFICMGANAIGGVMGRAVHRKQTIPPYVVTVISMGIGAGLMLAWGWIFQGMPVIRWQAWLAILWLAAVNTAFSFLLWNKTMQHLTAVESSNINNTMLIYIAILAWIFLGERLTAVDIAGLVLSMAGIFMIQMKQAKGVALPEFVD